MTTATPSAHLRRVHNSGSGAWLQRATGQTILYLVSHGDAFEEACRWWSSMASDPGAAYDDEVNIDAGSISASRS